MAVTACGTEEDRRQSLRAGFDHHLPKPFDTECLLRLLGEHRLARTGKWACETL